jgi:cell division transport system permease protein
MAASARVIQIQKLVGATNAFIRTPFLAEGMIQGFLAGALAMGLLAAAGWLLADRLGGIVFFSPVQIGGFILFCVGLGLVGSWSAMRKYLTMESEI